MEWKLMTAIELPPIDIMIEELQADSAVIVRLSSRVGGRVFIGTGGSKCDKGDVFDPQIGYELAFSRALKDLGRQISDTAQESVRLNERIIQRELEGRDSQINPSVRREIKKATSWNNKNRASKKRVVKKEFALTE